MRKRFVIGKRANALSEIFDMAPHSYYAPFDILADYRRFIKYRITCKGRYEGVEVFYRAFDIDKQT